MNYTDYNITRLIITILDIGRTYELTDYEIMDITHNGTLIIVNGFYFLEFSRQS